MRGFSVFMYSVKQGLINLKRNRLFTLASIGTMAACLFMFGVFYFLVSNFQYMIQEMETSVGVTVFFDEGATQEQMDTIGEAIKSQAEVDHVTFISAEEAWKTFKEENFKNDPDLIRSFGSENPLKDSASYQVILKNISSQEKVAQYIEGLEGVREVKRSTDTAKNLIHVNRMISVISVVIILILLCVSIFLINSTISTGITVRRSEIAIMRLMGASDYYIRAPFIIEGVIIGFVGAIIPLVILVISYHGMVAYVNGKLGVFSSWMHFVSAGDEFKVLVPLCFLLGIGIGFLGSFFTVRKHLDI